MNVSSFDIDHDKLLPGIYVSRKDKVGENVLTTFDIRMKIPNKEEVLDNPGIHTMEHLMATFLRSNKEWMDKIIYIGPMGCRTGMYLILAGDYDSKEIVKLMQDTFKFIIDFDTDIPATTSKECGNYRDHSLKQAKEEAELYYKVLINLKEENLVY